MADAGTATSKDLPMGKYTVTETKVPVTYEKDSTVHNVMRAVQLYILYTLPWVRMG